MTAQTPEKLIYNGEEFYLATEPLESYLSSLKTKPALQWPSTSCWRGYYGTWEIRNDKLYLIDLECYTTNKAERKYWKVGMDFVFPWKKEVLADWFTGDIRIPQGDLLNYVHSGYFSTYEKDLFLEFKNGQLIGRRTIDNYLVESRRIINEGKREVSDTVSENKKKSWLDKIRNPFKRIP